MPNIMRCIFLVCYLIHCVNSNSSRLGYMQSNYENVSDCFWNTFKPCYLDCMSGKSDLLAESIEIYYKQTQDQCHATGITIKIGSSVQFPKQLTMTSKWLRISGVPITELIVDCRDFNEIETDAFATEAFSLLTVLTLDSVNENVFTKLSLRGLVKLSTLYLVNFSAKVLRSETFDEVAETLDELTIQQQNNWDAPLVLDTVLGTTRLKALNRVKIYRNLQDLLSSKTFTGLVNVKFLDLSRCQITSIGVGVFDAIAPTIREVNLQLNQLTTLQPGVLDPLLLRPYVRIVLLNNWWACDCDLCYTKWAVNHGQNAGLDAARCLSPSHFRDELINATDVCANVECESYALCEHEGNENQPFCALPEPTSTTESNHPVNSDMVHQQCYDGNAQLVDDIVFQPRKYTLKLQYVSKYSVAVKIETVDPDVNSNATGAASPKLVWFEGNHTVDSATGCVGCSPVQFDAGVSGQRSTAVVIIINIQINIGYIFCVMQGDRSVSMSPLDCVPYVNAKRVLAQVDNPPAVWLNQADRSVSISMMVLAVVSSLLLGFCLGYMTMRYCYKNRQQTRIVPSPSVCSTLPPSFDGRRHSVCSTQSYAIPTVDLSRFDIVRRMLDKQAAENQYYLENMPEVVAPRPPSTLSARNDTATAATGNPDALSSVPQQNENIYADLGTYYKRF